MKVPVVGWCRWIFEKWSGRPLPKIWKKTSPIALTRSARKTYPSAFRNIKNFYQSPSSRRDILISVWAIFKKFQKISAILDAKSEKSADFCSKNHQKASKMDHVKGIVNFRGYKMCNFFIILPRKLFFKGFSNGCTTISTQIRGIWAEFALIRIISRV